MTKTSEFFDVSAAPMRIGKVLLKVRDLEAVSGFYRNVLGLKGNRDYPCTLSPAF